MKFYDNIIHNKDKSGGTIFELVASFAGIFILIAAFSVYASIIITGAKERSLKDELSNLRHSLEVYKVYNGTAPSDLKDLYSTKDYFITIDRLDKKGRLCDPFGHEYIYDPKKARIRSETLKYRDW